jgi:TonB family protein
LPSQNSWSQVKKQEISKYPNDKFVILSCRPNLSQTKVLNGKAIELVKPPYPSELLTEREKGAVNVQVLINETGKVISAHAVSGYEGFRQAAEEAARKSRFKQFVRCGKATKVMGTVVYNFVFPK